ncbi:MAG: universal stress protein [Solirubrobacteraceae bacterium]
MFRRVLVGVDGRSGGRDAIALAQQLVASSGRLVLVNIYGIGAFGASAALGSQATEARHLLACARQEHGLDCRMVVRLDSSPGRGLHKLAEHGRADLLVVGSSHRGGLGRAVIGDDTLAALNGAPCAVAIAPRGYVFGGPICKTIAVADDGSPESALALAAVRDLAQLRHAAIRVVAVVPLEGVPPASVLPTDWTTETVEAMRLERARLGAIPGATGDVIFGDPVAELVRLSETVDLLAVGSRGYGPLGRFVNGSVSNQLARRSHCPLLVMPRSVSETAPAEPAEPSRDPRVPAGLAS